MTLQGIVLCSAVLLTPLQAQSTKAELFGTIQDPTGLAVASAALELANTGTGVLQRTRAALDGTFHFLALPAGLYRLTVSRDGFRTLHRDGVQVQAGDRIALNLTLELGSPADSVNVTSKAPLLQTTRGTASFHASQRQVATLPLDGRNFIPLIALSPGVALPPGSVLPRINGSRPRTSEYVYDGISILQPEPGQVAYYPIIDAIDEFRVEINSYSAEYGRSNGGIIMVNSKSGGNHLHGTLFEFFRNEALNARNLFATTGPKPLFRRNQYGFALGGPVQRNRTFFFADWQGTRLATGVVRVSTVPTAAERQGIFRTPVYDPLSHTAFAGNTIPVSRFDAAAASLARRYPPPNVADTIANNYRRTGTDRTDQDQFDLRLDRYIGAAHRVFARYTFLRDWSRPTTPLPDGSGNITSGVTGDTLTRADGIAAEHGWSLAPNQVNQLRFGYTRRALDRSGDIPTYQIAGFQQLGPPPNSSARLSTSVTQIIDDFSWIAGRHSIKAGTDIRLEHLNSFGAPNPNGIYQFTNVPTAALSAHGTPVANTGSSFASFLLGQVQSFSVDVQQSALRPRAKIAEFFVQDDWRAATRLTLNLGVRYTLNFPSTVEGDQGAIFDLDTQQLDFLGQRGYPRTARSLELGNFGPRIGVAWQARASFVIRAGYGLTWIEQAGITTPFTTPMFPFIRTISEQSLDNIAPAFLLSAGPSFEITPPDANSGLGQSVFGVQRDQKSGYAQQWNFSLQKILGTTWSFEAGYLGSKLTNLGVPDVNLNQLPVSALSMGAQLTKQVANPYYGQIPGSSPLGGSTIPLQQLLRPYPRFSTVALYRDNVGHSTYHALQARMERRFSRGITFSTSYTFSRLIDDAGAVFDAAILTGPVAAFQVADSYNRRLEKDVSTGNIPHVFSTGVVWQPPHLHGWEVAGILRVQSGSPVAVTQSPNLNAFAGFGIQRPNRIADAALPPDERSTGRWFDTSAFTQAPQFTIGNSSRNPVVGPGYRTLDLMAGKTFAIAERLRVEFRGEAFNITNTPPLGSPNGSFGTAAFGTITTALDPRVFEAVVKLHF